MWVSKCLVLSPAYLGLFFTEKAYRKVVKRLRVKNPEPFVTEGAHGTTHFLETPDNKHTVIICVDGRQPHTHEQMVGLLVHEAVHVVDRLMDLLGEKHPSEEFKAYATQHVVQEALGAYNAWDKRQRKRGRKHANR